MIAENILWNSQSILECMGWRWRTLDLVWLYMQQLWRSWTVHYFYSFLFILHLKDILWIFFTYEKRNSWPPRNRLSGTVRLLKERSLRNSIKLVNIYYRDTNKERFNIGVILRNVFWSTISRQKPTSMIKLRIPAPMRKCSRWLHNKSF